MRVVSTACSNTEIVCALGCTEMLVGVDDHSDFPEDVVARLPRVGPDLNVDPEAVAALDPDLVLASLTVPGHEKVVKSLERAGLPVLAPQPLGLDDVLRDVRTIAAALGVPERGDRLAAEMADELQPAASTEGARRPSILVQWWPKPVIAPGRKSWVHDLLLRAGATHPLAGESVTSRPLDDEEVRRLAPDFFVLSWCGVPSEKVRPDVVLGNSSWQRLEAIREKRIACVPEALLGRPGPRLVEGYRALRRIVAKLGMA